MNTTYNHCLEFCGQFLERMKFVLVLRALNLALDEKDRLDPFDI